VDLSICEERKGPVTYHSGKAQVSHDRDKVFNIKVVEEPLYVKKNNSRAIASFDCCFHLMHEAHDCVSAAVVVSGTKLVSWEKGVYIVM
jgi:hypothetical protein